MFLACCHLLSETVELLVAARFQPIQSRCPVTATPLWTTACGGSVTSTVSATRQQAPQTGIKSIVFLFGWNEGVLHESRSFSRARFTYNEEYFVWDWIIFQKGDQITLPKADLEEVLP